MQSKHRSLRTNLRIFILLLGALSVSLALITGEIYRALILDHASNAIRDLVKLETNTQLQKHSDLTTEFAVSVIRDPHLKRALKDENKQTIQNAINEHFYQYYITAGVLDVAKIHVYDRSFQHIVSSSADASDHDYLNSCTKVINNAKNRAGIQRLKLLVDMCQSDRETLYATIAPVNTLNPIGYIVVLSRPVIDIAKVGKELGMPILIKNKNETLFTSPDWDTQRNKSHSLLATYRLISAVGQQSDIFITVNRNTKNLDRDLDTLRLVILLAGTAIAMSIAMVLLYRLNKTTIVPLANLADHFSRLKLDKQNLNQNVIPSGNIEIVQLTEAFNGMTSELSSLYKSLESMAYNDQLTALPNRSRIQELLQAHTAQSKITYIPFALFMMDLDRFKSVNDTLGHHAGDNLLQQVSERLSRILRKTDSLTRIESTPEELSTDSTVARLGGDEFAAILPSVGSSEEAKLVAKKILAVMEEPFEIDGCQFSVGVSIGAVICPEHGQSSEILMQRADIAMYQSKNQGTGFQVYDPNNDKHTVDLLTFDEELKQAIADNGLTMYYQPKIDLQHGTVTGVEALLRWFHPTRGFVPPDEIVHSSEQTGLIHLLTEWVIKDVCKTITQWNNAGVELCVSINLSAKNLLDTNLINHVRSTMTENKIDPSSVIFELTETAIMSDPNRAIKILQQLRELGTRLSIDDFGTGYSSLSYLKRMPVNEIKIDRSFVMDMMTDPNDAIIVNTIIDLAKNMSLDVTAEGIEDEACLNTLTKQGCTLGQGYFIAKPMPPDELLKWLNNCEWKQH